MTWTGDRSKTKQNAVGTADRIVAAAFEIVSNEGASALTMRRVAASVDITAMATYRHYPNRAAVLHAVAEAANAELGARLTARAESSDFATRFAQMLEAFLDFALDRPHLFTFLITEQRDGARRFPEDFRETVPPSFAPLVATVEQGIRDGALRPDDPLEVAMAINAEAVGLVQQYLSGRIGCSDVEFRSLCTRSMERMLNGLKA